MGKGAKREVSSSKTDHAGAFSIITGRLMVTDVSGAQAAVWQKSAGIARRPRNSGGPFPFVEFLLFVVDVRLGSWEIVVELGEDSTTNHTNLTNKDGKLGYRVIVTTYDFHATKCHSVPSAEPRKSQNEPKSQKTW